MNFCCCCCCCCCCCKMWPMWIWRHSCDSIFRTLCSTMASTFNIRLLFIALVPSRFALF
jgi:hypothetical protein